MKYQYFFAWGSRAPSGIMALHRICSEGSEFDPGSECVPIFLLTNWISSQPKTKLGMQRLPAPHCVSVLCSYGSLRQPPLSWSPWHCRVTETTLWVPPQQKQILRPYLGGQGQEGSVMTSTWTKECWTVGWLMTNWKGSGRESSQPSCGTNPSICLK